jgi:hypothetical protein
MKVRFYRALLLHKLGIRPVDLADNGNLNNPVAVYYHRLATMDDEALPEGRKWFPRYVTSDAIEDEIRRRSQEPMTDAIVANPMLPGGSPRAMVTSLVDELLCRRPDIRSVANIGAFVDNQSAWLAPRHSGVSFLSVDRHGDVAALNAYLPQSPNWTFAAGYPLDMLAEARSRPIFSS